MYTHISTIPIKIQNISLSSGSSFMLCSLSPTPIRHPIIWFSLDSLAHSRILHKQNQYTLLYPVSFVQHNICYSSMWLYILVVQCFLLPSSIPLYGLICWWTFGFFHFGAIKNKAPMKIHVQVLCVHVPLSLGKKSRNGIAKFYAKNGIFNFKELANFFPKFFTLHSHQCIEFQLLHIYTETRFVFFTLAILVM